MYTTLCGRTCIKIIIDKAGERSIISKQRKKMRGGERKRREQEKRTIIKLFHTRLCSSNVYIFSPNVYIL